MSAVSVEFSATVSSNFPISVTDSTEVGPCLQAHGTVYKLSYLYHAQVDRVVGKVAMGIYITMVTVEGETN